MRAQMTAIGMAVLALVAARGVAHGVTIAQVVASPDDYNGQSVTVVGTVEVALPVGSESGFDLRDGAAKLIVISRQGPPTVGARLTVSGKLRAAHEGGEPDIEANKLPPVLFESSREPAP